MDSNSKYRRTSSPFNGIWRLPPAPLSVIGKKGTGEKGKRGQEKRDLFFHWSLEIRQAAIGKKAVV
jgi:hypothetical protein